MISRSNTNKQGVAMISKWCEMDFGHPQYVLFALYISSTPKQNALPEESPAMVRAFSAEFRSQLLRMHVPTAQHKPLGVRWGKIHVRLVNENLTKLELLNSIYVQPN